MNLCEAGTVIEGIASNGSDRTWDSDAGKAGTSAEGTISDGSDSVRDGDAGEAGTVPEGIISDGSDRVRDGDAGEAGTFSEGTASNGSDRVTFNYALNLRGSDVFVCTDDRALPCIWINIIDNSTIDYLPIF